MANHAKAFTVIELVIVILIAGIIAALVIPKYIDLQKKAFDSQEEMIIGALREAAYNYLLEQGGEAYEGNPFDLLEIAPPNRVAESGGSPPPPPPDGDGVQWTVQNATHPGFASYFIFCPHYVPDKTGRSWKYEVYMVTTPPFVHYGTIDEMNDFGH